MRKDAQTKVALAALALAAAVTACGSDSKKSDEVDPNAVGSGFVTKGADNVVTLDFSKADANSKWVLMPYVLGDPSTVSGSLLGTTQLSFNVTSGTGGSLNLVPLRSPGAAPGESQFAMALARDHDKRTLLNRFDPTLGLDQNEGFWELARKVDDSAPAGSTSRVEEEYHHRAVTASRRLELTSTHPMALDAGGCPTTKVDVPQGTKDTDSDTIPTTAVAEGLTSNVIDGDSYCLVFLSAPKTEPSVDAIKSSIKTILDTYQTKIYKDTFPAVNGFTFKPVYVVVDISNGNLWDTQQQSLALAGAFISYVADKDKVPLIYMAADFSKVSTFAQADAATQKRQFHSVLAHETQHAILYYYRNASGGTGETIAVDEGLAHFMEDLFGYGADAFQFWAKPVLDDVPDGTIPFLVGSSDYGDKVAAPAARSSAHTLLYYLASQKGGVTFSDGQVSGGKGLDYIVGVVKNKDSQGPATLAAQFGGDWTNTVGQYLGARIVDNVTSLSTAAAGPYALEPVQENVKDLTGGTSATYGMRFNNFGGLTDHLSQITDDAKTVGKIDGLSYYMTKPVVYTVADPSRTVKFTLSTSGVPNVAVSAVRIK